MGRSQRTSGPFFGNALIESYACTIASYYCKNRITGDFQDPYQKATGNPLRFGISGFANIVISVRHTNSYWVELQELP
jgi:phage gp36-like protein